MATFIRLQDFEKRNRSHADGDPIPLYMAAGEQKQ